MIGGATIVADRGDAGERLDRVICRHLAESRVSRARVQAWIAAGCVRVNGAPAVRAAARPAHGAHIVVSLPGEAPPPAQRMCAEPGERALDVLFEDAHLLALNKPAGLVVHPTFGHPSGTLMNALLWYARDWPEGQRPALVGRLDKDTSGVLLVSKDRAIHAALQRATAQGAASKEYLALAYGRIKVTRGIIDVPLGPNPSDRRRTIPHGANAARSITRFERIAARSAPPVGIAVLRCSLETGRRHQIRAHLAARGWPIVGDAVYGAPLWKNIRDSAIAAALAACERQALHARRLAFVHPATGTRLDVRARMPEDLTAVFMALDLPFE